VGRKLNMRSGTKKSKNEKRWEVGEVAPTAVEEVGLGGVDGLVGLMMIIFGKKQHKLVLLYLASFS
jgi:hypothetical protein